MLKFYYIVLILIILEYIYIKIIVNSPNAILVLILIILEYIYIEDDIIIEDGGKKCLNPYYTGIHLHEVSYPEDDDDDLS